MFQIKNHNKYEGFEFTMQAFAFKFSLQCNKAIENINKQ